MELTTFECFDYLLFSNKTFEKTLKDILEIENVSFASWN